MGILSDIQTLEPGARVELYELDATAIQGDLLRFHGYPQVASIWWQGNEYVPWSIKSEGWAKQGTGQQASPKLTVGNIGTDISGNPLPGVISSLCIQLDDLVSAKVIRHVTLYQYMDPKNYPPTLQTVSRSTQATFYGSNGLIQISPPNTPRYSYNPVSLGSPPVFLLESAVTNLFTYSEVFKSFVNWGFTNSRSVSYATTAPDGSLTGNKLVEDTTANQHLLSQGIGTVSIGSIYTVSIYAKAAERTKLSITSQGEVYNVYDLVAGTVVSGTGSIQNVGNGWYRCSAVITKTNTTGTMYFMPYTTNQSYLGDGVSGVYVWGAQCEAGAAVSSYIPSSVTFTSRASTATYFASNGLIQTAAVNVPRMQYNPSNLGIAPKLLLEPAATNYLLQSSNFGVAPWGRTNCTATIGSIAPDGTTTASAITRTAAGNHFFNQYASPQIAASKPFTFSVWLKSGTYTGQIVLRLRDGASNEITTSAVQPTTQWQRFSLSGTFPSGATGSPMAFVDPALDVGGAGDIFYCWGAQLEDGLVPTSYIDTTTVAVTRSADVSSSVATLRAADVDTGKIGVNPNYDPTQELTPEIWFIEQKTAETSETVEFTLSNALDFNGVQLPSRQIIANVCTWIQRGGYRGPNCGYTGPLMFDKNGNPVTDPTQDICAGTLSACKLRFGANEIVNFGGFPAASLSL